MAITRINNLGITDSTIVNADISASAAIASTKLSGVNDAKAFVNFNGTGTVAIRASFNVSSITDLASGQYEVNFTTAISDANYAVHVQAGEAAYVNNWSTVAPINDDITTSKIEIGTTNGSAQTDAKYVSVTIFR